jgi:hypothetical protein
VTDILNCPFCGNAGRISYSDRGETFSVRCVSWGAPATACKGSGPYAYSEADAIAAWNRRALLDELDASKARAMTPKPDIEPVATQW